MKKFSISALVVVIFCYVTSAQDVNFDEGDESSSDTRAGDLEDDVNTRFFNLDLNQFGQQVAAGALGSVLGNAGSALAGNYLNNCNNRGKRSLLMHAIEKRDAQEIQEKTGNSDDPEVAGRIICPQDFFPGNNNNNHGSYCDRCNCRDYECQRQCRKCSYSSGGFSSGGNTHSSGSTSCHSCSCSSYSCRNKCSKCSSNNNNYGSNNNNSGSTSCYSCSCSQYSCRRKCSKCSSSNNNYGSNNNNYGSSNWSSWSSGSSYGNNGWRNKGTSARSEGAESVADSGNDGAVIF